MAEAAEQARVTALRPETARAGEARREPLARIPRAAWRPLLVGSACISAQGILLITSIAFFGDATSVNIVYSVRSLWMVVVVWWIGHWFHNAEQQLGRGVLGWRLTGAALMTAAVGLALA